MTTASRAYTSIPSLHDRERTQSTMEVDMTGTPARPIALDRSWSTPPLSPTMQRRQLQDIKGHDSEPSESHSLLTPPTSPVYDHHQRVCNGRDIVFEPESTVEDPQSPELRPSIDSFVQDSAIEPLKPATPPIEVPLFEFPYDLEVARDETGRRVVFGAGAWSTVYKAFRRPRKGMMMDRRGSVTPSLVVAVKTPDRIDGQAILQSEAQILSHLMRLDDSIDHIVPFHGYIPSTSSIVMEAVPLSLADLITNCATEMRSMYMRHARTVPVIGSEETWLILANSLISSLRWLHEVAEVVHGDIKPHNILLQPLRSKATEGDEFASFPYKPLLIDFSSACHLTSTTRSAGALSAVTREYTAPELLSSKVLRDPATVPTTAADVFSLAVTLLVSATGDLNVYPASNPFQRQAMASQGWGVIGFARNGDGGLRVPRFGIVEQVLEMAVLKDGMGRIDAGLWAEIAREKTRERGDPVKKG